MTPTTDADFERLGREEAKRLGDKSPTTYSGKPGWFGHSLQGWPIECDDIPLVLWWCMEGGRKCPTTNMLYYPSEVAAYAALGRAVHAARVATGYYEAAGRARREAIAEVFGKYSHLKIDLDDFMKEKHDESDIRALLTEKGADQ